VEPPGTAPGSGPLITREFIAIVSLRRQALYRGESLNRKQLIRSRFQRRIIDGLSPDQADIHAQHGQQHRCGYAQQRNRSDNPEKPEHPVHAHSRSAELSHSTLRAQRPLRLKVQARLKVQMRVSVP
jgi:hypothetical protein